MGEILTCTWAPTVLSGPQLLGQGQPGSRRLSPEASGDGLRASMVDIWVNAARLMRKPGRSGQRAIPIVAVAV